MLPPCDEIAWQLHIDPAICEAYLSHLKDIGLLDDCDSKLQPHKWDERQFVSDIPNDRVRKFRENKRLTSCNVTQSLHVTPPDTESDTEQIQNQNIKPIAQSRQKKSLSAVQEIWFAEFWSAYWRRIGRGAAETSFARSVPDERAFRRVMQAIALQAPWMAQRDSDKRPYPATWLNQKRWEDDADIQQSVDQKTRDEFSRGQVVTALIARKMQGGF